MNTNTKKRLVGYVVVKDAENGIIMGLRDSMCELSVLLLYICVMSMFSRQIVHKKCVYTHVIHLRMII